MPPKYPFFRKGSNGTPVLYDSEAARKFKERAWFPPQAPSQVENAAKECVRGRGGDVNDRRDLLGMNTKHHVTFKKKTFPTSLFHTHNLQRNYTRTNKIGVNQLVETRKPTGLKT